MVKNQEKEQKCLATSLKNRVAEYSSNAQENYSFNNFDSFFNYSRRGSFYRYYTRFD